jgi:molybdopterin-containing oxidoreductase family iron-sulfur binding subunit
MTLTRTAFLRLSGLAALIRKLAAAATPRRWAMAIDTQKCLRKEGCTKCLEACHQVHNVPHFADPRREVKWIWKEPFRNVFPSQQSEYSSLANAPVMVLCNQCEQPPCVRVCPTRATWKREDGIVMMDWHRCIGCRYCIAGCPYGSRSFNWLDPRPQIPRINPEFPTRVKGVVEKCNFCEERLAKGQAPACVESCPEKALVFGNLHDPGSEVRKLIGARYTIRRKPELGTRPGVFYIV